MHVAVVNSAQALEVKPDLTNDAANFQEPFVESLDGDESESETYGVSIV